MRALILDDEFTAVEYLAGLVEKHCPEIESIQKETSPEEAIKILQNGDIDIFFSDIEMGEMNGLQLVQFIGAESLPPIIFTTAYDKYALEAFRANAIDYLLKPIDPQELREALTKTIALQSSERMERLEKLMRHYSSHTARKITVADGQHYHFIDLDEVIRAEGSGSYTTFYLTDQREIQASRGLKYYEKGLDRDAGFLRTHQSHLINLKHVQSYRKADGGEIFLIEGHSVPVSTRLRSDLQNALRM